VLIFLTCCEWVGRGGNIRCSMFKERKLKSRGNFTVGIELLGPTKVKKSLNRVWIFFLFWMDRHEHKKSEILRWFYLREIYLCKQASSKSYSQKTRFLGTFFWKVFFSQNFPEVHFITKKSCIFGIVIKFQIF
jgi:hypothetical protein